MRIDHISLACKPGELDKVADYYEQLGFEVYKKNTNRGLKGCFMEHKTDRSCKIDIRESNSEPFSPFLHFCFLVDDVQRAYDELKANGFDFGGDHRPPTLQPSGRILPMWKGPYGIGIQLSSEMRKEEYVEDYVKSLFKDKEEGKDVS
jgi:catechol 2,3-dioxygenase-like lactoylglutathione lyase family enzyme